MAALQYSYTFEAIGTPWVIETDTQLSKVVIGRIHEIVNDFDQTYSRFRLDSLVSRARAEAPGSFVFPDSIAALYDTYVKLERATDRAVNPLIGQTLEHWGYDANYSLSPAQSAPTLPSSLVEGISKSDTTLIYHQPALLDIGAIGKGYLVDMIAEYIAQYHQNYTVDAGGDIAVSTNDPYVIGLEHPLDFAKVIGTVSLQNQSICGSSPNRRSWGEGLHHIIDATTGHPIQSDIVATWAIADSAIIADALATALFFAPPKALYQHFGDFRYIIMRVDSSVEHNITDIGTLYADNETS
jgi:FAD:protein FMN transferase